MLTQRQMIGLKSIASAVLRMALVDSMRGYQLADFAESEWCEELCGVVGISWVAYKRGLAERMAKCIEDSKPKRLRTYELVEVLKNGKHQRECEGQEHPCIHQDDGDRAGEMG